MRRNNQPVLTVPVMSPNLFVVAEIDSCVDPPGVERAAALALQLGQLLLLDPPGGGLPIEVLLRLGVRQDIV